MNHVMNQTIDIKSELGGMIAEYGATKIRSTGNLWSGRVFIALGVIGLLVGMAAAVTETGSAVIGFCGGVGLLSIAGGAWAIRTHRQEKEMSVQVYRHGLVSRKNGRITTMRWQDVQDLIVAVLYNHKLRSSFYHYTLKDQAGAALRLNLTPGNLENPEQLAQIIQHEVTQRQLAQAVTKLNAGQPIQFGPLTVTRVGIQNGRRTLPWLDYAGARVSAKGYFQVEERGRAKSWARIDLGKMPNVFTFLALANQLCEHG